MAENGHRQARIRPFTRVPSLLRNLKHQLYGRARRSWRSLPRFAPLARICGIELLTTAALAGILGPGRRCATAAQLAAYAGVAPLEASSAERVRHRLNRGGNRRLNAILYRVALTQTRASPLAQAYLAHRISAGKTRREAIRARKRHLVRVIWRAWQECQQTSPRLTGSAPILMTRISALMVWRTADAVSPHRLPAAPQVLR